MNGKLRLAPIAWLLLALAALAPPAGALDTAGVPFPPQLSVEGKTLVLNGAGIRSKFFVKVYVGALYLEKKSRDAAAVVASDEAKQVVLHFLHSEVAKEKLVAAWKDGFEANSGPKMATLAARIAKFDAMMVDVVKGDRIELTWVPGVGTKVKVKGKEAGVVEGKDFADALFSIWLGPKPAQEGLKKEMLGG
jgi:hypothetical protein